MGEMRVLFLAARLFPFFGVCSAIIFTEMGRHFRRKKQDYQYYCWFWAAVSALMTLLWFVLRGDINSDEWVRTLFG